MTALIVILSFVFFFAISAITHRYINAGTRILYHAVSLWVGYLFCVFLILCLSLLISLAIPNEFVSNNIYLIALGLAIYTIYQARRIKITQHVVKIPELPPSWQGRRAVFLSDIHLGQINGKRFAQKIVDMIKKENPDIIFITGDVYDGVMVSLSDIIEPFTELKPQLGTYFVRGNHEEYGDSEGYIHAIKQVGIIILENTKIEVEGLAIIGVDYRDTQNTKDYALLLDAIEIDQLMPTILLKHVPIDLEIGEQKGIDLQLSGHTHQGQMFPFNILTHFIYKGYDVGLKRFKSMQVLTTSGVSTWGPPMRLGTKSEIIVLTFE